VLFSRNYWFIVHRRACLPQYYCQGKINFNAAHIRSPLLHNRLNHSYRYPNNIIVSPQLYSKYPNMPVTLQLKSVKPPTVKVVPGSADLQGVGHVEVYVMNPNTTTRAELAFTIGVVRMYKLTVFSSNQRRIISFLN